MTTCGPWPRWPRRPAALTRAPWPLPGSAGKLISGIHPRQLDKAAPIGIKSRRPDQNLQVRRDSGSLQGLLLDLRGASHRAGPGGREPKHGLLVTPRQGHKSAPVSSPVPRSRPRTNSATSLLMPIDGPPINSHARSIPISKQTATRIAIVTTAPESPGSTITSIPRISCIINMITSPTRNSVAHCAPMNLAQADQRKQRRRDEYESAPGHGHRRWPDRLPGNQRQERHHKRIGKGRQRS